MTVAFGVADDRITVPGDPGELAATATEQGWSSSEHARMVADRGFSRRAIQLYRYDQARLIGWLDPDE